MLKKLLDADEIQIREEEDEYWLMVARTESSKWWRLYYRLDGKIHEHVIWPIKCIVCKFKGHDWEVEAHITPDSGSEYFYCKRCNTSHTEWYY